MASKARIFKPAKPGPTNNKKANPSSEQKGQKAPEAPQKPADGQEDRKE